VPFADIDKAIAAIGRGEIVVVVDDETRENEGDLIMAAEYATPDAIAFFLRYTSGVICVPMTGERLDELQLPLMVATNTESQRWEPKTSPVRHSLCTRTSTSCSPATSPFTIARWCLPSRIER
jgi:3,4-dihydroxy-2-butanone 4-phosphate synthase